MRVLINMPPERAAMYSRPDAAFAPLGDKADKDSVAVVVRGASFAADLPRAASLDIPVVVVAGTEDAEGLRCMELARSVGIPDGAVIVKRENEVCALDGRRVGMAVRQGRGIGVASVVLAAKYALANNLIPEPVIWEENVVSDDEPVILMGDPEVQEEASERQVSEKPTPVKPDKPASGNPEACPVKRHAFARSFADLVHGADRVVAVFRAVPDAKSGRVAQEIAQAMDGQHVELSAQPQSYKVWGHTLDEALAAGYLHSDGKSVKGESRSGNLVIEVDLSVFDPEILDLVYKKAEKVIQVVTKNLKEGEEAVQAWLNAGWRLDAVIPDSPVPAEALKKAFGERARSIKEIA